ncbi:hypothetical protein [Burkholderia ambifaria]|nr:hypothetical protein [Burkholderia ambifaria]
MTLGLTPCSSRSSSVIASSEIRASVSSPDTPKAKLYQDLQQVRQGQMTYVTDHAYKSGTFTGTLRDGKPYEGFAKDVDIIYKKFDGVVKEGALAYEDRTRMQRPDTVTPFQQILRQGETPFQRLEAGAVYSEGDEQVRRKVLNYDLDYVELSTDEKFDVTNDNQRRFFDTVFAKEMLTRVLSDPKSASELRQFSDKTLDLFCTNILSEYLNDWKLACAGKYTGKDQRLQQLSTQTLRAHEAVENLPLSAEQKQLCLDLYERRYLNYLVDETDAYKNDHPRGIIKSKTNPLYFKRGRLDGDFALRDSMHAGILRNIDQCPVDLRFSHVPEKDPDVTPGLYTRCPDRLHMANPDDALDNDPDSWLSRNFLSGNTPYVNGLSGSMLIEIGGLTYIKEHLNKEKLRTGESEDFLASRDMIPVLDNYFRALAALYVYLDGGHSLFEIQSSFKQTWVAPALTKVFKDPQWGKVGQDLYQDVDTFKAAWQATRQFDNVVQNKQNVHGALREAAATRQSSPDTAPLTHR